MSNEGVSTNAVAPWSDARADGAAPRKTADLAKFLPIVGPVVLVLIWDLVVRFADQSDPFATAGRHDRDPRLGHARRPAAL